MTVSFFAGWFLLALLAIYRLLIHKRDPYAMIAWLLLIVTVPFIGALSFFLFGPQRLAGYQQARTKKIDKVFRNTGRLWNSHFCQKSTGERPLRVADALSKHPVTGGNAVSFHPEPDNALEIMCKAAQQAKHFIHIEYFIVDVDSATERLFNCLSDAVQRGVEVRLLYDVHGSLASTAHKLKRFKQQGLQVAGFLPLSSCLRRLNINFRNHRKSFIVDGRRVITGGTNLSNRYLGRLSREDSFHDYTMQIDGPAALQANETFVRSWYFATGEDLMNKAYFPEPEKAGDVSIQMLEGYPDKKPSPLYQTLIELINSAEEEILLVTPYFIPDQAFLHALQLASLRGVKVQLLLPSKLDIPAVGFAANSFYDELLDYGIEISLHQRKILHAKLLVVDQRWTLFGSANMDMRSFSLNFELCYLAMDKNTATQAREIILKDLSRAVALSSESLRRKPQGKRLVENACRIAAPIM